MHKDCGSQGVAEQSLCIIIKDRWTGSQQGVCDTVQKAIMWAIEFAKREHYGKRGVWVLIQKTFIGEGGGG